MNSGVVPYLYGEVVVDTWFEEESSSSSSELGICRKSLLSLRLDVGAGGVEDNDIASKVDWLGVCGTGADWVLFSLPPNLTTGHAVEIGISCKTWSLEFNAEE